jgi:hypothetical protein
MLSAKTNASGLGAVTSTDVPKSFSIDEVVTGPIEPIRLAMLFDWRSCRAAGKANLAVEGAKYTVHQKSRKVHIRYQEVIILIEAYHGLRKMRESQWRSPEDFQSLTADLFHTPATLEMECRSSTESMPQYPDSCLLSNTTVFPLPKSDARQ